MPIFMMFGKYSSEALKGISSERTNKAVELIKENGGKNKVIANSRRKPFLAMSINKPVNAAAKTVKTNHHSGSFHHPGKSSGLNRRITLTKTRLGNAMSRANMERKPNASPKRIFLLSNQKPSIPRPSRSATDSNVCIISSNLIAPVTGLDASRKGIPAGDVRVKLSFVQLFPDCKTYFFQSIGLLYVYSRPQSLSFQQFIFSVTEYFME